MRSWSPNIQSQYVIFFFLIFLAALLGVSTNSHAQTVSTVTMTDTTVVGNNARAGLNLDQPTSSSPNFKNYYAFSNPGFEPVIMQQVYQFQSPQDTSSPTSFRWNASNAKLVSYDSNQWAGATFTVVQGSHASGKADPALGCSGTVKSSTNERGAGPVFVINPATNQGANGCAGELGLPGQVIIVSTNSNMASVFPTPASVWTGAAGLNGSPFGFSSTGGATIASETGDLCPSCGRQALRLTIPGGGSARLAGGPALNTPSGKSVTLNGTYTMSFWAKSDAAVPPKLAVTLTPRSGSACTEVYSGSSSPAITSTWTQFSFNCVFAETPSAGGSNPFNTTIVATSATGATTSLEFDNVSFTNAADTNPTAYSDAYVDAVQSWCQSTGNTTGPQCTLRYSASLASDSMSNWVEPQFERQPSTDGYTGLSNAGASIRPGLFDFLNLCAYVGATPVLTFPDSATTTDVQNLVDFLEGSASTTYGNIRASLGQMTPWVGASGSPFQVVYLEFGSQSWNTSALGNTLGSLLSTSSANLSLDYAVRAGTLFGAARAWQSSQGYTQSATKWVLNLAAFSTGDAASALQTSRADAGEVNAGTTYSIGNRSTAGCLTRGSTNATCPLYGPALTQAWANTHDASSQFYQSISAVQRAKVCGPSGTAACHAMLYQDNANAIAGAGSFGNLLQPVPNGFSQGGVQGVVAADLMGENDAAGIVNQNQFTDLQDFFQSGSANAPVLGSMIDIGGDCSMTNSAVFGGSYCPRPQMLGTQVYNWCKIGPMVQTSWTSNPVYNLPVNNNGVRAISNVPVLHSFAFEQGNERCMVIVNTDVYSAHTIMFSGANAPGNDVTTYQFAPSSLASTNQAIAGSDDGSLEATMWNTTTPSVNVSAGYSLPPHSVTAFKWEAGSDLSAGAATSLSPAGGTVSAHGVTPDLTAAATLVTTPVVNFPRGFAVNQNQLHLMGSAIYSGPALQLTNLAPSEMAAAWYVNPVNVQSFTSDFTFQLTSATADGFTFTIQNNGYISGYSGDYLGYGPNFTKSLAIKFDLYNNAGEGTDSTGLYTDGAIPTVPALDMTSSGVNLHSGDSMAVHLVYDGTTLSMTVTDLTTNATYTTSGAINIPSIVGGDTAYVGFTGGTGGSSAIQNILTWTYSTAATSTPALPAPTFSIAAGTYSSSQSVTLSDATAGTTIYYTTNGTTPTTSSTKYTGAITVGSTETLEAIAVETGYTNSPVATATYTIGSAVPAPTFSLPAGTYENSQVSITDSVSGATIYYTYEVSGYGIKPTTSSTKYTGPIELDQSGTFIIEAIAVANGTTSPVASVTYTIHPTVAKPVFSPAAGSYSSPQTVTISDVSTTATIYYTTNGSTPTTSSTKYSGPMTVSSTETINAIATISGDTNSPVATAAYTMSGTLAAPVFSVPAGTYSSTQTVTLSDATAGTTIYYTTNGSTPTTSSTKYTGAITVSSTETLEAIAVETGYTNSPVATAAYTINPTLPAPTFSVAPGSYTASQSVTISDATAGTTIYYTTNGATPTTSSTKYTGAITVSSSETLEAIAVETGYTNSPVATAAYTIDPVLPAPTFSVAPGSYTASQSVSISDATAGTTIYYTTNGSTPTTSSTTYTGPITVSSTETLEAIAVETGYTNSPVATAAYTIDPVLPAPTFSVAPGSYTASQSVSISDATAGTTIYYTTNGSTPTTSSTTYTGPITVSSTETLEAIAVETGYTNSPVATAAYTINITTPPPTGNVFDFTSFSASTPVAIDYSAALSSGAIELTPATTHVVGTAWYKSLVNVSEFTTTFTFQITPNSDTGNGFTFTIQNNNTGNPATSGIYTGGSAGEYMGYYGLPAPYGYGPFNNLMCVKFDTYTPVGAGTSSTGLYVGNTIPAVAAGSIDTTPSGVNLLSGDIMSATLTYDGTTLTLTLTDTVTKKQFTTSWAVNIPANVNGNTAYVGFTAATGAATSVQNILTWNYSN